MSLSNDYGGDSTGTKQVLPNSKTLTPTTLALVSSAATTIMVCEANPKRPAGSISST